MIKKFIFTIITFYYKHFNSLLFGISLKNTLESGLLSYFLFPLSNSCHRPFLYFYIQKTVSISETVFYLLFFLGSFFLFFSYVFRFTPRFFFKLLYANSFFLYAATNNTVAIKIFAPIITIFSVCISKFPTCPMRLFTCWE